MSNKIIKNLLSFVIPCYRSELTIGKVISEIIETVSKNNIYDYEIICVNDFSPDNVYKVLKEVSSKNNKIKVINFAKNMGKHAAVLAGHAAVKGEYVVDLDDDFQSPTYELYKLLEPVVNDECDVATAIYKEKKESLFKRIGSDVNLLMSCILLDHSRELRLENFMVMKRFVSDEIINYKHPFPYLGGLILRTTRRIKMILMEERSRGDEKKSGFTFKVSLCLLANGLTAFSVKPLRLATIIGLIYAIVGFIWGIILIIKKIMAPNIPAGWTTLIVIILFSFGLLMMMIGIIGEYIGRIYICMNNSPQYVIKDTINIEKEN